MGLVLYLQTFHDFDIRIIFDVQFTYSLFKKKKIQPLYPEVILVVRKKILHNPSLIKNEYVGCVGERYRRNKNS